MTVGELKKALKLYDDDTDHLEVLLAVDLPSRGPQATVKIRGGKFGFDWDRDFILKTERPVVPKDDKQGLFEAGYDLLMWLATKPVKKLLYEVKTAQKLVSKYGRPDYMKFAYMFHDVPRETT